MFVGTTQTDVFYVLLRIQKMKKKVNAIITYYFDNNTTQNS